MEIVSPVGRFVQGSVSLEPKIDMQTKKPKLGDDGQPIKECFMAIAIPKTDPNFPAFYATLVAQARSDFPHLFDAGGNCTHPRFSWKIQDGDGVDHNGKSVKDRPGFAGNWIFKLGTRYLPKCYHYGKYDPAQQIQNPAEIIKRGYYVRCNISVRGNGVTPQDSQQVPGLFLSPNLVELVAFGEEIVGGADAASAFGSAAPLGALPPGASATPVVGAPGLMAPPAPVMAPPAPVMAPPAPVMAPPAPVMAPPAPRYVMQASAMGATHEQLLAQGWTDATLIQHGHMIVA